MAIIDVQKRLQSLGFDPGPIDGIMGPKTEAAIIEFQHARDLVPNGALDSETSAALGITAGAPPSPPSPNGWLQLLDISAYQGVIDFTKVRSAGYAGIAIKATEGLHSRDPRFTANWRNAKAAGLMRYAYHFLHPNLDGGSQADLFLHTLDGDLGELVAALDWEYDGGVSAHQQIAQANAWFAKVDAAYGRYASKPFVYSYSSFLKNLNLPSTFAARPLWLAGYVPHNRLVIPSPWTKFDIWQYKGDSKTPSVPGILDDLAKDYDQFLGTAEELLQRYGAIV